MSNSRSFNYECLDESKKNKCCYPQSQSYNDNYKCDYNQPSDCYNHKCDCKKTQENCKCNCGCTMPKKSLFACKPGNNVNIPTNVTATTPILVANLALDTSCCCNPSIKVDFNSLINYTSTVTGAPTGITTPFTATFQLSKACSDGNKMVLGTWDFTYASLAAATNVTVPFNFTYCECNACGNACGSSDCCVYTLEIIRTNATTVTGGTTPTVTETINLRSSNIAITAICS